MVNQVRLVLGGSALRATDQARVNRIEWRDNAQDL